MIDLDQAGGGRNDQIRLAPPRAAAAWLEYAWVQRHERTPARHRDDWRIVPDTAAHVVIHAYPRGLTPPRVIGPRSRGVAVSIGSRRWTVGLRLRPGALAALLREPADRWADRSLALEPAVAPDLRAPLDHLGDAGRPAELALRLADLVARAFASRVPDWRVRAFERAAATASTAATPGSVSRVLGLAPRTLRAVIRRELGLSPRRALRILRVQRAAALMTEGRSLTLSRVAHATEFADHPHLTREFGRLVGEPPTSYLARAPVGAGTFKSRRSVPYEFLGTVRL